MIEKLESRLIEHMNRDEEVFSKIALDIEKIKENHLAHIQSSMNEMEKSMAVVTTDVSWLKKWFWLVATASIGSLVTGLISIIFKK